MSQVLRVQTLSDVTVNLPMVLATATSVGLHALLWVYQPVLPMSDKSASDVRRSVRVVQLTPNELLRLPQYSTPQPSVAMPSVVAPTNVLPNLPKAESGVSLPPPPSFPIYNPSTNGSLFGLGTDSSSRSQTRTPASPSRTTKAKPTPGEFGRVLDSQQSEQSTLSIGGQTSKVQELPKPNREGSTTERLSRVQEKLRRATKTPRSQLEATRESPSRQMTQEEISQARKQAIEQAARSQPLAESTPPTSPDNFSSVLEKYRQEQKLAPPSTQPTPSVESRRRNDRPNEQTVSGLTFGIQPGIVPPLSDSQSPGGTGTTTQAQSDTDNEIAALQDHRSSAEDSLAAIRTQFGYKPNGTSEIEMRQNYISWVDKKTSQYPGKLVIRGPKNFEIASPLKVKLPDVTPASVLILVGPEGKIVEEPELLRSTGYPKLDDKAIEKARKEAIAQATEENKKRRSQTSKEYRVYQYFLKINQEGLPSALSASSDG